MNIAKILRSFNKYQQNHTWLGFPVAVFKKFGDDAGGYQAALITYYGFLSLFPLLLVLSTILEIWFGNNPSIQAEVSSSIQDYLPLLGNHLQDSVHGSTKTGVGLAVGIVIILLGARGGADAFRFALNIVWATPKNKRSGFPHNIMQSFIMLACGAAGFTASVAVSSLTSVLGQSWPVKLLLNILGILVVGFFLTIIFRVATTHHIPFKKMLPGAFMAAVAVQILITFGGILVKTQLKNLGSLYGTFAIVLGLLFWIYLLARIVVFTSTIDSVRVHKLWPRSLDSKHPTVADKNAADVESR